MNSIFWMDHFLPDLIGDPTIIPLSTKRVLELGTGNGLVGKALRLLRPVEILDGVEIWDPYCRRCRYSGDYDLVLSEQVEYLDFRAIRGEKYDLVLCLELLEHLDKVDAGVLLEEMKAAGRRVVVTTPGYSLPQGELDGNPYQTHKSVITVQDLRAHGYRVRGLGTLKNLPIKSRKVQKLLPGWHITIMGIWDEDGIATRSKLKVGGREEGRSGLTCTMKEKDGL